MAKVGAQRAAELTGRSKSTIQRAMNSGKISYELDSNGRRIIDVSEIERAFGIKKSQTESATMDSVENELKKASDLLEAERMKMRIRMLEEQLDSTRDLLNDMRDQRDQWQKQAQQVLITSQYSQKQAEELQAEVKELERKETERRRMAAEARMKKMSGDNQNRREAPSTPRPMTSPDNTHGGKVDFQGLWKKIKGETAATG